MFAWRDQVSPMRRERAGDRVVDAFVGRPASLQQVFREAIEAGRDREALICDDVRISWAELDRRSAALAGALDAAGVAAGDRVAVHLPNSEHFIVAFFAAMRLGAVFVPISAREKRAELAFMLAQCGARALINSAETAAEAPEGADVPALAVLLTIGAPAWRAAERAPARFEWAEPAPHDVAILLYTSGTTGRPKGAMITHFNAVHQTVAYVEVMRLTEQDRTIVAVPLSHVTGLLAQVTPLILAHGALVIVPAFKAGAFLQLAARERMTHIIMVPAMYNLCLLQADVAAHDLSAWRIAGYGGAPMPLATIDRVAETWPAVRLMNLYGATEATGPSTMLAPRFARSHRDTVGLAAPGAEIAIMDDDGVELPRGQIGEIWMRGAMVVPGYWDNPAATASEFVAGFWKSGDLGTMDEEGFIRVLDRKKDMINRGGYKIFSAEVESVLAEHPAVVEAAVIARPCPVLGERVHAVIVLREEAPEAGPAEFDAYVAARLADYKRPETWDVMRTPLPRNANGKILKKSLRAGLAAPSR